jgi:hypothetical protein
MAGLILQDFLGRRIDFLGSNPSVNFGVNASYPIFTTGTIVNRSPSGRTVINYVVITPNTVRTAWNGSTCTFNIDGSLWAISQDLALYPDVPAVIYPISNPLTLPTTYPNAYVFNFNVTALNAANGIATVAAYGCCE